MKLNKFLGFLLTINLSFSLNAHNNKIIYMISPPRSLSVAFLRMMQARGDFKVMNEPSEKIFNAFLKFSELPADIFTQDAANNFDEVKDKIFEQLKHANVFVKEMSFAVKEPLLNDITFITDPNVQFVFLLRNPHHVVISFYNKAKNIFDKIADLSFLIGYESCFDIYQEVNKYAKHKPIIILSEDFYLKPKETIEKFCKDVGISFKENCFSWENLGDNYDAKDWSEIKKIEITNHWHKEAIKSNCLSKPTQYQVDSNNQPTFSEIIDLKHRQICIDAYRKNLISYKKLLTLNY